MTLKSARGIVERDGYAGLNVRKIAKDIGYSVGTIYNLFENFDTLILHLNGRTCDDLYDHLQQSRNSKNPEKNIKALTRAYIDFLQKHPKQWAVLFEHSMSGGADLPPWYLEKLYRPMGLLEKEVATLTPGQSPEKIKMTARILWSGLHGICSLSLENKLDILTPQPVTAVVEQFVEDYLRGIKRAPK